MAAKKPKPTPEPERVKFTGTFDELAERIVKQPGGKAPERPVKQRKARKAD